MNGTTGKDLEQVSAYFDYLARVNHEHHRMLAYVATAIKNLSEKGVK